jgi:hypothetical protein
MSEIECDKLPFWTEYASNHMEETSKFLREMFGWKVWPTSGEDIYLMHKGQPIMNIVQYCEKQSWQEDESA